MSFAPILNMILAFAVSSALSSSVPRVQQPADFGPVIRSTTNLVEVQVLVSSDQGSVPDLREDDFVVTDQGARQRVTLLKGAARASLRETALAPNTFSNRQTGADAAPPSITVLLLDGLNTRFEDQKRARQQLIRALGQIELGEKDRVAVYVLGTSLRTVTDFVDPEQTRQVLEKFRSRLNTEMDVSEPMASTTGDPRLDTFIDFTNSVSAQAENADRAGITMSALAAIANHVASVPGRKNLLWMTGSLPVPGEALARILNAANLSVYPIDARGLIGLPPELTARAASVGKRPPTVSLSPSGLGNFQDVADATGGRAWINGNDLGQAVRGAFQDSQQVYTLSFQPSAAALDGKYHDLRVELRGRHPGLKLRYRRGYIATKDTQLSDAETAQRLRNAVWSPLEASGLTLSAQLRADVSHPGALRVSCTVDPHQILFDSQNSQWKGALDVLIVQEDASSKLLDSVAGGVDLQFGQKEYEQHLSGGVAFFRTVEVKPGLVTLRILVQDRGSGLLGSLIIPASRIVAAK